MQRPGRPRRPAPLGPLEPLEGRALLTMAVAAPLPAVEVSVGAAPVTLELDSYFKDARASPDYAMVNTTLGTIPVLTTPSTTPAAVASFKAHLDAGDYNNTIVDRSVPGQSWATGAYHLAADSTVEPIAQQPSTAVAAEAAAGGPAARGTVAIDGDAAGGVGHLIFNDQAAAPGATTAGGGTVFGRVVGTQGLAVLDAMAAVPVPASAPLAAPLGQAPLQFHADGQPVQAYNFEQVGNISTASALYEAVSSDPSVAEVAVHGDQLSIRPLANGIARVAVVAYGSDGVPVANSFAVDVDGDPMTPAAPPSPAVVAPAPTALADPIAPRSTLTPAATGTAPATAVAGAKAAIRAVVTLASPVTAAARQEHVQLALSRDGASPDYAIIGTTARVPLQVGRPARVALNATHIGANVPAGAYHVVVTVTDPAGGATTVDTGRTIDVLAAGTRRARA